MNFLSNELNYDELDNQIKNNGLNYFTNLLKSYDDFWHQNIYDKTKYKYVKTAPRSPNTQYGKINDFYRRCYLILETNEYYYPLDDYIKIKKRKRTLTNLEHTIIKNSGNGKRQSDVQDIIKNSNFSKTYMTNVMKNAIIGVEEIKEKKIVLPTEKLFINMDDCFISSLFNNKKQKNRIRIISANKGKDLEKSTKSRNVLKDKKITYMKTKNGQRIKRQELIDKIYEFLDLQYIYTKSSLVFIGDGAPWIKTTAKNENIPYVIDRHHAFKALKKGFIFNRKVDNKKLTNAYDLFVNGEYYQLLDFLKENKVDEQIYKYFKNNKEGVINQKENWNQGVCAESDVSHLVKSLKGYGAKIYNDKVLDNMLIINSARINKLNLLL
ncbi:Mbov_0401 family ICE element transposase-like protein [Spiroplasma endosymbiont of Zeiraphera isertana]|uniref:Mbov_0401 family ICE element transposase-like protein n=1 Tax=Spiroplasma endosymbiont of Zeiraphera isertana TaxID=3066313 RepID=UPI00313EC8D5